MTQPIIKPVLVEACVESPTEAIAAQEAGAGRLELCAGLLEGGTTPSAGMIAAVLERVTIPVVVMIRPRGGDFVYSRDELGVMQRDIVVAKTLGVAYIATGVLTSQRAVDRERLRALVGDARPLEVTFHRAFDFTSDLDAALDELLESDVDRVLTSGGKAAALEGASRIARLRAQATDALTVMAGGGVRAPHARELVERSGVRELHARPVRPVSGAMLRPALPLGASVTTTARTELAAAQIRALVEALA